jgi:methionyl-tRNA synthetase
MSEVRPRPVVITATAPTPNGSLHIGHLSGPYVAADVAARAARARGEQVIAVGGIDPHQNYVVAKSEIEGRPVADVLDGYSARVRDAFARARISYDVFVEPQHDGAYRDAVARLVGEMIDRGNARVRETTLWTCAGCRRTLHHGYVSGRCPGCGTGASGGTCEGCARFLDAGNLVGARCAGCGGEPHALRGSIPVLRLEEHREQLLQTWARASLSPRIRALVGDCLDTGLPDVPLAYPTDWGIPLESVHGADLRVDVWVEMGLGYLYALARHVDPGVDATRTSAAYVRAWEQLGEMWHFLGIDNAFYFAVLFPALLLACGLPAVPLGGIVVNEFYRLDGAKFSTSRDHAIWADEFLAAEDPAWVRLYLCWDRPDRYESDFTRAGYDAFRDRAEQILSAAPEPAAVPWSSSQDAVRAEHALRLAGFDPALAVRCALSAAAGDRQRAMAVLAQLASGELPLRSLSRA